MAHVGVPRDVLVVKMILASFWVGVSSTRPFGCVVSDIRLPLRMRWREPDMHVDTPAPSEPADANRGNA
jgi:hypothetical protein